MNIATATVPVITIDGPTASGKGTISTKVAQALGWAVLDSGALYRLTALAALEAKAPLEDEATMAQVAATLDVRFHNAKVYLAGKDVTSAIRAEAVGNTASKIAAYPAVRTALLQRQRDFLVAPGLVADGRDMGTVVFPDAPLKIFLSASVEARADRRAKQLKAQGISANLTSLLDDLKARDARDSSRSHAPLRAASDAISIDSSQLSIEETVQKVLAHWSSTV